MNKVIIAGGSGFLGSCIADHLVKKGYHIVILSRYQYSDREGVRYIKWDAKTKGEWTEELEGASVLINLTGKSVDCRYNDSNKALIYSSRLDSTNLLGEVMQNLKRVPKVWINAASATIYRHALDRDMDEYTGEIGEGFSVDVCQKWEATFDRFQIPETRKVLLRIGIVLGKDGGALVPLKNLAKIGFGGKHGNGNQYFSWLHEADFKGIVNHVIANSEIEGVYNATSPNPVPNHQIMAALRKAVRMPWGLPMPTWLLKVGAAIIRTEPELILKSRRVVPKRLLDSGFKFQFSDLDLAIRNLTNTERAK